MFRYLSLNNLSESWRKMLLDQCQDELCVIDTQLNNICKQCIIYPPQELIFNALSYTSIEDVKVVILGQDPYHGSGEANGLAFSVNQGVKLPPSLRNIYKELSQEYSVDLSATDGTFLFKWAQQGVLLLNSSLTVIKDQPNSLANIGWASVTDKIIHYISTNCHNVVFLLWGKFAGQKSVLINDRQHLILETTHPSPFSAHKGFLGCGHFLKANQYLIKNKQISIDWLPTHVY